ncbi:UNVERIFIED_CONTAM: hypothetical protein Slati_2142700 [Sesamum latifolium]|uniref:Transposase MuDR plant domain-containing protein n=1 Tax=Sesamum latifolium TaxID=2727402 RepID=A0AAW2WS01_9LAMI
MSSEVGFMGNRTYYTLIDEVYYRHLGLKLIYVEVDGNVMGREFGEKNDLLEKSDFEDFENSDFDMKNDDDQPKIIGEGSDGESLEKKIEKEVEEMNMKESNEKKKEDVEDSKEDSEADLIRSHEDSESHKGSDEDETGKKHIVFNPIEQYDPTFELCMIFSTKIEFRNAVHSQAIKIRRHLKITKNDKKRIYAKCGKKDNCQWRIHADKVSNECTFQIREYNSNHSCGRDFNMKNMKSKWLAEKYVQKFRSDPKRNVKGFTIDAMQDLRINVSRDQAYRAKRKALKQIEGSPALQYAMLQDYACEFRKSNPGSTVVLGMNVDQKFEKFYVYFGALKEGFNGGCRPLVGVDGIHLKGPFGGIILTAVGIDPNNNIYPITYAIVAKEMRVTWEWFLTLLKSDLGVFRDDSWCFIFDQKGVVQAFE